MFIPLLVPSNFMKTTPKKLLNCRDFKTTLFSIKVRLSTIISIHAITSIVSYPLSYTWMNGEPQISRKE